MHFSAGLELKKNETESDTVDFLDYQIPINVIYRLLRLILLKS